MQSGLRAWAVVVLICAIWLPASAQFKSLLGGADAVSDIVTPIGIRLNTAGFDVPRRKRQRKSENWLRARGVPEQYIWAPPDAVYDQNAPDFRRFTERLWATPNQLAAWTDEAWVNSGRRIDPRTVRVVVMPAPFWVQAVQQWRMSWAEGRTVYVAVVHVSLTDDGVHARVRNFRNELGWAFANQLR